MAIEKETLRKLYEEGQLSIRDIAKKLGCSITPVKYWMKKHGIKSRTLSESGVIRCEKKPQSNPGRKGMPKSHKSGKDNHQWKGGRSLTNNGYMRVRINGELVLEHRYVWEKHNGQIPKGYQIHHIDEDKLNNKIENLQLMKNSEHQKLHKQPRNKSGRFKQHKE